MNFTIHGNIKTMFLSFSKKTKQAHNWSKIIFLMRFIEHYKITKLIKDKLIRIFF